MHVLQLPVRAFQIIFSAIVLALSVVLIKGQLYGNAPTITKYEAFCGAFGVIVASLGFAAAFVEAIPGLIMAGVDALCTLFFLAGSVALAVKLKVHSCAPDPGAFNKNFKAPPDNASPYTFFNEVINAGIRNYSIDYPRRCHMAQADTAFLFFALGCFVVSIALDLMGGSSSRGAGGGFKMPGKKGASHV